MVFASTLIYMTHTGHTRINILIHTHKDILTPPVLCTHQLPVLHWMNKFLIQKLSLQSSRMSLLFKNYALVEVIYLLITSNMTKSFLWNAINTDGNGVNEQNTHTAYMRRIALKRVSYPSSVIPPVFRTTSLFYQLFPFHGETLNPALFSKISKT